ncbi:MAG: GNAT family N-acetyltransferase [Alphaproteobacteria bacterium]|nr:GNAT family N-acetyltransferase [Alphaproteobacteria bacterium]
MILHDCLSGERGFALGAFQGDRLVGYRLCYLPDSPEDLDDNVAYREWSLPLEAVKEAVRFAGVAVSPEHRRRGLAGAMTRAAVETATGVRRRWAITSCHPDNHVSETNLRRAGFVVVRTTARTDPQARQLWRRPLAPDPQSTTNTTFPKFSRS